MDLPLDMGWIVPSEWSAQKIELHTASEGSGTKLPEISIGVDDLEPLRRQFAPPGRNCLWPDQRRLGSSKVLLPRPSRQSRQCCRQLTAQRRAVIEIALWAPISAKADFRFRVRTATLSALRTSQFLATGRRKNVTKLLLFCRGFLSSLSD